MSSNKATGKPDAKPALTPKLRFPEFQDEPGWVTRQLGQLCRIRTGKKDANEGSENGQYPFFTCAENHIYSDSYSFDTEAILVAGNACVGQTKYYKGKFEAYQRTYVLSDFSDINVPYLYEILSTNLRPSLLKQVQVSAMSYIKLSMLEEYELPAPTIPKEQQKIAECLTTLDEGIGAHSQKLAALQTHKKGLMQQLFPRAGETLPRLRFPEFQNAPEWNAKQISDVVRSVKTGKLDANAMVENGGYRFYTCAENYYQIDNYAFEGEALPIAGNGANLGYIHHYIGKFNAYQRTYVLQEFDINVLFLKYYLDCNLPARISLEKKAGNTPYIVLGTITEMPLLIPKDKAEQQRIGACLTSLDDLIAAQSAKLEALKTHKQGLMQQLFPSPEDIQ